MSRQRLLYLVSLLLFAAAAGVYAGISQPASDEARRLATEKARLESEISRATAELRRLEGTEPPRLPPASMLQERVSQIASMLPATPGYSVAVGTPQPFPGGDSPLASRVPVTASAQLNYDGAIALLTHLSDIPYTVITEVTLSSAPATPGALHVRATLSAIFQAAEGSKP